MRNTVAVATLLGFSSFVSPDVLAAQQAVRLGAEFRVNLHTVNFQRRPGVAASTTGEFVVVWHSYGQDGANTGIFGQRFNSAGAPQAVEFQVNSHTVGQEGYAAVAIDSTGDFVVAWESAPQDGSYQGIFAQRFDAAGVAQGSELAVNVFATREQRAAAVASASDGDFVIVWDSNVNDGDSYGIFARRYDAAAVSQASEFQVNAHTSSNQLHPAVASDDDGDFVIAWESLGQDGSLYGVFARRFDSGGGALATEFQVNSHTAHHQRSPALATHGDGDFMVAWQSYGQDGDVEGVFARRFDSAGAAQASEFQASSYTAANQRLPDVTTDVDGGFVVVWESSYQDGNGLGLRGRRFDAAGVPLASEFQVNSHTLLDQSRVAAASAGDGHWIATWQSLSQDGDIDGIFAQRFAALAILDVDADGSIGPLTDGLLVLRFLFGFTGSALVNNATGPECTRCDAGEIASYLTSLDLVLDIDDGSSLAPLTDGLLILRFLFGFTGGALTNNAVGDPCNRCDAAAMLPYLESLG